MAPVVSVRCFNERYALQLHLRHQTNKQYYFSCLRFEFLKAVTIEQKLLYSGTRYPAVWKNLAAF